MSRQEHLEWCKKRALEYCDAGKLTDAFNSMTADLRKHPETEKHPGIQLGVMLMMINKLNTKEEMRKFIDGFN